MSRNMRAVKVDWGDHAAVFLSEDDFEQLLTTILRQSVEFRWNDADEVHKFWTERGAQFLDAVRDCVAADVASQLDTAVRDDAMQCLNNLKALEPEWRMYLDKHGKLEIWVDGY